MCLYTFINKCSKKLQIYPVFIPEILQNVSAQYAAIHVHVGLVDARPSPRAPARLVQLT